MHYLYETNFNFVYDSKFYNLYLEYLISKSKLKQNELIKEIDIPSSTFTRVKRKGYADNKIVRKALEDYFNVKTASKEVIDKLQEYLNASLTYVYYSETIREKNIFLEAMTYDEATRNTPVRLLFWALVSITYNPVLLESEKAMKLLDDEVDYVLYMVDYLAPESRYIITYALYEYALHKDDFPLAVKYSLQIEELLPQIPELLQSLGNFIGMVSAIMAKDHSKAFKFINRSLELQNTYFAPKISVSIKYHLFLLYNMIEDYEKMVEIAEKEILYLQFAEKEQAFYFSYLLGLVHAYVVLERYDKAKVIFDNLKEYDLDSNIISKGQVKALALKREFLSFHKLFMYYKENNEENFKDTLVECEALNKPNYIEIMELLKKGNINSLKKAYKLLNSTTEEKFTSQIHSILAKELKTLLNK